MFSGQALLGALPWTGGIAITLSAVTFVIGIRVGRHNVADTTWGLLFAGIGITTLVAADGVGDPVRRWLLAAMVTVWGVRLAVHTGLRAAGKGEDPRYEELLSGGRLSPPANAVLRIYLPQTALAFVIAAPIQVGAFETGAVGVLGLLGVLVWAVGLFWETVGDAQMERYKEWKRAQPEDQVRASVMDKGLWRFTRHPNYFGDACVWWGLFLVAAESWPGILTIPAPLLMTYLLVWGSGMRNLERSMTQRPGYPEYTKRTSGFVPLPARNQPEGPPARQPAPSDISLIKR